MKLDDIRTKIDKVDRELLVLLQERMGLALRSKKFKPAVTDTDREQEVLARAERMNLDLMDGSFTRQLLKTIITESKRLQEEDRRVARAGAELATRTREFYRLVMTRPLSRGDGEPEVSP